MTQDQDQIFAKAKNFAIRHSILVANPLTERLSPIIGAISLGVGYASKGRIPRSHNNLISGANAIATARGENEHPNILAWKIASNQVRNNLLSLRVLTRNDSPKINLALDPTTEQLKNGESPYEVVTYHSVGDVPALPRINGVLAGNRGLVIAAAPQPDKVMRLLYSKAKRFEVTIADTSDTTVSGLKFARTFKKGGVAFLHQGTKMDEVETPTKVNFLGQNITVRENIFGLAVKFGIPVVAALTTIEGRRVKIIAGPPIETKGKKTQDIAQEWADAMTVLVKQYPTSFLAVFELEFSARR
jgi:hypothetical protein